MTESTIRTRGRPRRSDHPERIQIADEEFVRNDIVAAQQGESERNLNRDDARGAPYMYFAGVKYRPIQRYHQYLLRKIIQRGQPPLRRRAGR